MEQQKTCPEHGQRTPGAEMQQFRPDCEGCRDEFDDSLRGLNELVAKMRPLLEKASGKGFDTGGLVNQTRLETLIDMVLPTNRRERFVFEAETARKIEEHVDQAMRERNRLDIVNGARPTSLIRPSKK